MTTNGPYPTGYYNAGYTGSTTIYDNGSGSPYAWGTGSAPSLFSPDYVSNGTTYSGQCWGNGISPSAHNYYIEGDVPSYYDGATDLPFALLYYNPNAYAVGFQDVSGIIGKNVPSGSSLTVYTNTSADSIGTSPNTYGYPTDGTGTTPNYYRTIAVSAFGSNTFYSTPSAWSSPNYYDPAVNWYSSGSFSGVGGASSYILEHSTDGVNPDRYVNIGTLTTIDDDMLGEYNGLSWTSGAATITPTSYLPPAIIGARNGADGTGVPTWIIQDTQTTNGMPYLSFQDGNGNESLKIIGWYGNNATIYTEAGLNLEAASAVNLQSILSYLEIQADQGIYLDAGTSIYLNAPVIFQDTITSYNNTSLVALGVPILIGAGLRVSLGTSSTSIASYTPTSSTGQNFIINWSLSCKTSSTPTLTLTYTDPDAGTQSITLYNTAMTANQVVSGTITIVAKSSAAIAIHGTDSVASGDIYATATIKQEQ
jgi:hypothetical protein